MNTVTLDQIRRLLEADKPLNIIDVRTPAEFSNLHARGARLLPLSGLTAAAACAQGANGEAIYLICQSGSRAAKAWQQLDAAGVPSLYCIEGGTAAWEKAGLPVERGRAKMISLERQVRIAAGSLVLIGAILAWSIHPLFLILPAFVGAGLIFAGITDFCGMGLFLARLPWNRRNLASCKS